MADCDKYVDMISALIDGELTDNEIRELKEHARNCRSCTELIKLYSAMSSAMGDIAETPPNDLSQNIMRQIRYDRKKSKRGRSLRRLTAVAAVLVVVISVLFFVRKALPFSGSSDDSSVKDSAVMEAAPEISPEEFASGIEDVQASDSANRSKSESSLYADTEPSEQEPEQSAPEESDPTFDILEEESPIMEVFFTDGSGNETAISVEANLLNELLSYTGVYGETVTGEPVCSIKFTINGEEQMYSVWVSNESVLVQGADGVVYTSAFSLESFENLLP